MAYTSFRFIASKIASRVLSVAHTAAMPDDTVASLRRCRLGRRMAHNEVLPTVRLRFDARVLAEEIVLLDRGNSRVASVVPIIPNLKGLIPNFVSAASRSSVPRERTLRQHVFLLQFRPSKLALSHVS